MALHKALLKGGFKLPVCEKHFHEHDETWLILQGRGAGYWIDHGGQRQEFILETGDAWMIPAGYEHGSEGFSDTGKNSEDFTISVFNGTEAPGCHKPGHYYLEKEGYLPSFEIKRNSSNRYHQPLNLPAAMRGIIFAEKGKAVFQQEPTPGCRSGTLLCQTLYTGLTNGTERNLLCGGNYSGGRWPNRCGYQNVGRVLAAGMGVKGYQPGDIVFSGDFCQHVQYFAASAGGLLIKLPPAVDPRQAALLGLAGVAMHDVRRAQVKLGEKVLVVGAGPIGQFTAQAARLAGATVAICDLDAGRLAIARELGAHAAIPVTPDRASWEVVKQAGPFDAVFEDSGGPVLDSIIGSAAAGPGVLKHRARVTIIAGRERVDYSFNAGQNSELCIFQAGHFEADDLHQACRFVAEGLLRIGPIIKDVVPIDRALQTYETLRDNPGSLFGTVFDWQA